MGSREERKTERLKIAFFTFGCQMNKLDSEIAVASLVRRGFSITQDINEADGVIFNTCSVRQHAEERVVSRIAGLLPLKRKKQGLLLGIIGCMGELHGRDLLRKLPHVDLVAGTNHFHDLGLLLERAFSGERVLAVQGDRDPGPEHRDPRSMGIGPSAYVAVQRGCSMHCSYCVVPKTRGKWRSRSKEEILEECRKVIDCGVVDITLLGQTVDAWGRDLSPRASFADLLESVHSLKGIRRLHFVTSHPLFLDKETAEAFSRLPRLAKWVHLPAQSGSNRVLGAMRRGYTVEKYMEIVEMVRRSNPDVEIASDFICGFPGEEEEDHEKTLELVDKVGFSQCYVFKYSPRPGTEAWSMDPPPEETIRRRHRELLQLHEEIALKKNKELLGTVQEILVQGRSPRNPSRLTGRSWQNRIVHFPHTDTRLVGKTVRVKIKEASPLSLVGELVEEGK